MAPSTPSPNVLPDWWSFVFMGLQLASLLPLVYQNLFDPITTFKRVLPPGYDAATDGIKRSLRVEMAMMNSAQGESSCTGTSWRKDRPRGCNNAREGTEGRAD